MRSLISALCVLLAFIACGEKASKPDSKGPDSTKEKPQKPPQHEAHGDSASKPVPGK